MYKRLSMKLYIQVFILNYRLMLTIVCNYFLKVVSISHKTIQIIYKSIYKLP